MGDFHVTKPMTAANEAYASSSGSEVTDQAVSDGEEARQRAAGNADLLIDVFDVIAGGLARNHQTLCDFGVGKPQRQETQHLDLAGSEAGRQASAARDALAHRTQRRIDRTAVESARIRLGSKVSRRVLRGARGPMRSVAPTGSGRRRPPRGSGWQATARYRPARADNPNRPVARDARRRARPAGRESVTTRGSARSGTDAAVPARIPRASTRRACPRLRSTLRGAQDRAPDRPGESACTRRRAARSCAPLPPPARRRHANVQACMAISDRQSQRSPPMPRRTRRPT